MNRQRLLERFLRYVKVDTTAVDDAGCYPSSPGQFTLGKILAAELQEMGLQEVQQDEYGLVYGTLPAKNSSGTAVLAFNSHVDTSPETTGKNVNPQVIDNYAGGNILLAQNGLAITTADNPDLEACIGKTIITTDGSTLLGGDDKAGIAVIMETVQSLAEDPNAQNGLIRVLFTCDEEIGHGVDHVDFDRLGADVCYTLDGAAENELDVETFSADGATVTIRGINIHPSIAKDRMVNALRATGEFLARLPHDISPERTESRDGFIHPVTVTGGVAEVTVKLILRSFETEQLAEYADLLNEIARDAASAVPGSEISVRITEQYRNFREGLSKEPRAVAIAEKAHANLGRTVHKTVVRGGTDGSLLTAKGLPTPNLSTGQHNPHSPLEWACLDQMVSAVEVCQEIAKLWSQENKA